MAKTKVFIALGTLILGVVGFLVTNANRRPTSVQSAWFRTAGGKSVALFSGVVLPHLTTAVTAGRTAFFKTGSVSHTLFSTVNLNNKLYGK